jgi:hypothetical protein
MKFCKIMNFYKAANESRLFPKFFSSKNYLEWNSEIFFSSKNDSERNSEVFSLPKIVQNGIQKFFSSKNGSE